MSNIKVGDTVWSYDDGIDYDIDFFPEAPKEFVVESIEHYASLDIWMVESEEYSSYEVFCSKNKEEQYGKYKADIISFRDSMIKAINKCDELLKELECQKN